MFKQVKQTSVSWSNHGVFVVIHHGNPWSKWICFNPNRWWPCTSIAQSNFWPWHKTISAYLFLHQETEYQRNLPVLRIDMYWYHMKKKRRHFMTSLDTFGSSWQPSFADDAHLYPPQVVSLRRRTHSPRPIGHPRGRSAWWWWDPPWF